MSNTIYKNRFKYYQLMQDFADGKMDGITFRDVFLNWRRTDLHEDKVEYPELKELSEKMWRDEITIEKYDKLVKPLRIYPEDGIFLNLFDILQSNDIEDFWPRNDPYFEEAVNIDEDELRRRVKEKLKILDENRDKW